MSPTKRIWRFKEATNGIFVADTGFFSELFPEEGQLKILLDQVPQHMPRANRRQLINIAHQEDLGVRRNGREEGVR
jgi:hypothetical protein